MFMDLNLQHALVQKGSVCVSEHIWIGEPHVGQQVGRMSCKEKDKT